MSRFMWPILSRPEKQSEEPRMTIHVGGSGKGLIDETGVVQAAVDACPDYGTIDGGGRTYLVSRVVMARPATLRAIKLVSVGSTVDRMPVIDIGAPSDLTPRRDFTFEKVEIDGQRHLHTGIGGQEDGARHGIRATGVIRNIRLVDCHLHHCASDGLYVNHGRTMTGVGTTDALVHGVEVVRCRMEYNRRHGGSSSGVHRFHAKDSHFEYNGLDVGPEEGAQGARVSGNIYAMGWDAEDGSSGLFHMGEHVFEDCHLTHNATRGFLGMLSEPNDSTAVGWKERGPFLFTRCRIDRGQNAVNEDALRIVAVNASTPRHFDRVALTDCAVNGRVSVVSVADFRISGGTLVGTNGYAVILTRVDRAQVMTNLRGMAVLSTDVGVVVTEPQTGD